jgi:hypothetical protein
MKIKVFFLLIVFSVLVFADGKTVAKNLKLDPSSKAINQ